jgi:hypothetical protein
VRIDEPDGAAGASGLMPHRKKTPLTSNINLNIGPRLLINHTHDRLGFGQGNEHRYVQRAGEFGLGVGDTFSFPILMTRQFYNPQLIFSRAKRLDRPIRESAKPVYT